MQLSPYGLRSSQHQSLAAIYCVHGAETLVVEETVSELRKLCQEANFNEREKYNVEAGFDWDTLLHSQQAMSLFSQKKTIELRLPNGKPGDKGAKALQAFIQKLNADTLLILISGAIDKRSQNSAWFKALNSAGVVIDCPEIKPQQMGKWIETRMRQKGLQAEANCAQMIAQYVEGNLLAAAQEVNLLSLHCQGSTVTLELIHAITADQSRFTGFSFVDACLEGNAPRLVRILKSLERDGFAALLLVSALARETRKLSLLANAQARHKPLAPEMKKLGVWSSKQSAFQKAVSRHSALSWHKLHHLASTLDASVKGQNQATGLTIWQQLEQLGLAISGDTFRLRASPTHS